MPDRDHWSASMLLCWILTRDSNAVLSMADQYGGWLVEGDNVTRTRPQSWDDVLRSYSIDDSLPIEEKAVEAVVKAGLFVIPARDEIYSSLRCGKIDSWARPNGSGDIVKIEPIQWAGLRFRAHDGHDIAVPVDSEQNPLPLPRPLADYVSGSVPPTSLPTVWPDPLFLAEHVKKLWEPHPVSSAPPAVKPLQESRETPTDLSAATNAGSSQDAASWWSTTTAVDWVFRCGLALTVEQILDALEDRCVSGRVKVRGYLYVYASNERIRLNPAEVELFSERHGRLRNFFQDITVDEWRDLTFFPLPSIQSGETWAVAVAREFAGQPGPRMALRSKYLYRLVYADPRFSRDDVTREWPESRSATDAPERACAPPRGSSNSRGVQHRSSYERQRTRRGAYFGALEQFITRLKPDAFARMSDDAVAQQFEVHCEELVRTGKSAPPLPRDRRNIENRVRKIRQRL